MFHDLGTSFFRVMFSNDGAQLVVIEVELSSQLVRRPFDKAQFGNWDAERCEDRHQDKFVVLCSVRDEFKGSFKVVQERMDI